MSMKDDAEKVLDLAQQLQEALTKLRTSKSVEAIASGRGLGNNVYRELAAVLTSALIEIKDEGPKCVHCGRPTNGYPSRATGIYDGKVERNLVFCKDHYLLGGLLTLDYALNSQLKQAKFSDDNGRVAQTYQVNDLLGREHPMYYKPFMHFRPAGALRNLLGGLNSELTAYVDLDTGHGYVRLRKDFDERMHRIN